MTFAGILGWFGSRILVFPPTQKDTAPPNTLWAFLLHHVKPVGVWLGLAFAASLLLAVTEILVIIGIGSLVDLLTRSSPEGLFAEHGPLLASIAGALLIVQPGLTFLNEVLIKQTIVPPLTGRVTWQAHLYALGHSVGYFRGNLAGRVADRVVQIGPALRDQAVFGMDAVLYGLVFAVMASAAFTTISFWLALPLLGWLIGYALLTRYYVPRMRDRAIQVARARSRLLGGITDSYANIVAVKLFSQSEGERSFVKDVIQSYTDRAHANLALHVSHATTLAAMNTSLLVVVGALSVALWSAGRITVGEVAAGLALVIRLSGMSVWFLHVVRGLYENLGTIRDSMATLAEPHSVTNKPAAEPLEVRHGEIRFENVVFTYPGGCSGIGPINLIIRSGERIGLIGPSGAGKTTLVSLLLRLYDLDSGRILIDGQDIAQCQQESLRAQIGVVPQDGSLFHRTIRENVAYGKRSASDADILRALQLAHAESFVKSLRDADGGEGLNYLVGDRGEKISSGERQRIAIARALLKNAPILVLDEATSFVDNETAEAIRSSLNQLMHGRTVIAIAHRLSTIQAMDRLVVMSEGKIVEEGTHKELARRDHSLYARLWSHEQA